jgi:uncharacterized protein YkwD
MHVSRSGRLTVAVIGAFAALAFLFGARAGADLVAPGSKCPGQQNTHASEHDQEHAMQCLLNYARKHAKAGSLKRNKSLERAAGRKAGDVMRCGPSHTACGHPADAYAHQYGYMRDGSWAWGENIGWGDGRGGTARAVFGDWLNDGPHRETMLRGSFEHLGIGLKRGSFQGHGNSAVWVIELGCHGC